MKSIKNTLRFMLNESEQPNMKEIVSHVLSPDFIRYTIPTSFTINDRDESTEYEFKLLIPKNSNIVNGETNESGIEKLFRKTFGTHEYSGAGGQYTKTSYLVNDTGSDYLITVNRESGYDI